MVDQSEREVSIKEGLNLVQAGRSLRSAAQSVQIPVSTLRDRLRGAGSRQQGRQDTRKLSDFAEKDLVQWILDQERYLQPPTHQQILDFATIMLHESGVNQDLGQNWVSRFIQRHKLLQTKTTKSLESARSNDTHEASIRRFWSLLDDVIRDKSVGSTRIYNMDETGIQEGGKIRGKVVGSSLTRRSFKSSSPHTSWVSIIECIAANGQTIPPCVIFKGSSLQGQWFPKEFPHWSYESSPSGWSNGSICLKWFKTVFLPETTPLDQSLWRILVIDGHKSHVTGELMFEAWKSRVYLLYLPAHTSHITQPLDVSVFGPLKTYFHTHINGFTSFASSSALQKQRFLAAYQKARDQAMTSDNIRSGFHGSGIYPNNVERALASLNQFSQNEEAPRPLTPEQKFERLREYNHSFYYTPTKGREIRVQVAELQMKQERQNRGLTLLAGLTAKSLDQKNAQIAGQKRQIQYLEDQLASYAQGKKKKVFNANPNDDFASIEAIEQARREAVEEAEKHHEFNQLELQRDAEDTQLAGINRLSNSFVLE